MKYSIRRPLNEVELKELNSFSPLVSHLLFHRGFDNKSAAQKFLNPNYDSDIHDAFLMKDLEKAAERIVSAIKQNEKIAIYADYDADGIPGAAMWNDFFGRIGFSNFIIYIPHRHDEGFGLNIAAVDQLAKSGVTLIVTLDCGISDTKPVAKANELGLQVIITDHHEPPPQMPEAYAVVDHKQLGCNYPDKNLCGTGVGFKLIQGILAKERFGLKEGMEKWLLDLVGMATMSDMVNLVGENRVFAYYGLSVLRKTPRKGLIKLFEKLRMRKYLLAEDDIAFMITPRINAASRMGVPMDAFKLLSAMNDNDAQEYADHLDQINNERKGVVASLVKEVKKTIKDRAIDHSIPSVIVLGNPEWRPSLLGLAANTCAEEFDRPVFLWGRDGDNSIKGSCRSEGRTHVVELMRAVPLGIFTQFGGHHHSGGFAVAAEAVHFLEQRLNEAMQNLVNGKIAAAESGPKDWIDAELDLDALNWSLYNDVAKLAPFGVGNPKPVFLFKNLNIESIKKFGKKNEHIELGFKKTFGERIAAIAFFAADLDWASELKQNQTIDLIACLEKSTFKRVPELRLRVMDVVMKQ